MKLVQSIWDSERNWVISQLKGEITTSDVLNWKKQLLKVVEKIPDGTPFKLLLDLYQFEPVNIDAHKCMRNVIPELLASHGLRPAFIDLFDPKPEMEIKVLRGVQCIGFANIHHDVEKMTRYQKLISQPNQQFFFNRTQAESWLAQI